MEPRVLRQPMPSVWWPPHWPGWKVISGAALLWLLGNALYLALNLLGARQDLALSAVILMLIAELVYWTLPLAALGLWLSRGRIALALTRLRQWLAQGLAGTYLWQVLVVLAVGALLAWPILVGAVLRIFAVPNYQE